MDLKKFSRLKSCEVFLKDSWKIMFLDFRIELSWFKDPLFNKQNTKDIKNPLPFSWSWQNSSI